MPRPTSVADSLQALQTIRLRKIRASQEVLDHADFLLAQGVNPSAQMGDEYWAFLEQLAIAAMDIGRMDVAEDCISQLDERFPESPRVQILHGMMREASGKLDDALELYNMILDLDEANAGIWKRRIAVYKQKGDAKRAVDDLIKYLDTFYTDVEGWLELADFYSNQREYSSSLQALSHAMAIAPQNPFYVLLFAETAGTAGQWALALKMFLRVIEMVEGENDEPTAVVEGGGPSRRAWFGVKLATQRLREGGQQQAVTKAPVSGEGSETKAPSVETLRGLDELATERIAALSTPTSTAKSEGRRLVLKWIGGGAA